MAVNVIEFSFPGLPGVGAAFTTAAGGAGQGPYAMGNISYSVGDKAENVLANRQDLQARLGFAQWHTLRQVHGVDMVFDPEPMDMAKPSERVGDGLATSIPGQALAVKTADCQPILLAHASGRYVAGLHAGWRGNVLQFPTLGVRAFCERYGIKPRDVLAVRGPSLGPAASQFTDFALEFGSRFADYHDPRTQTVNLWRLTKDQLLAAGLAPDNIFSLDLCTKSLPQFFSYRRAKVTGRQASLIWIKTPGLAS